MHHLYHPAAVRSAPASEPDIPALVVLTLPVQESSHVEEAEIRRDRCRHGDQLLRLRRDRLTLPDPFVLSIG
jgi:hypothetical protein